MFASVVDAVIARNVWAKVTHGSLAIAMGLRRKRRGMATARQREDALRRHEEPPTPEAFTAEPEASVTEVDDILKAFEKEFGSGDTGV
jgi:hypothetical protein